MTSWGLYVQLGIGWSADDCMISWGLYDQLRTDVHMHGSYDWQQRGVETLQAGSQSKDPWCFVSCNVHMTQQRSQLWPKLVWQLQANSNSANGTVQMNDSANESMSVVCTGICASGQGCSLNAP